jgi:serine/threonine-protein kinase HipA
MQFTYDAKATQAISLAMPVRLEPYNHTACEIFFAGLLPESELAKKEIGRRYGVSHNNTFALLRAIGYDCAGAISCHAIDDPITFPSIFPLTGKIVSTDELYQHIKALPQKPLFMDFEGLRLSLAGVHDKAAVCMLEDQIALPQQGCPTTYILKTGSSHYEGMVENEYFCMKIAGKIGLPVPKVEIKRLKDISFLLIERYDRIVNHGQVSRIHQEDFCQALGILSSKKYQSEGGPGFNECFELISKTSHPAIYRNTLVAGLIFNYLIGNMDAHAKNFSLLHQAKSDIRLAPFYDLLCTRVYEKLTSKMSMKIGSKYDADALFPRHFEQLCESIHYKYPAMMATIQKQADMLLTAAQQEKQNLINMGYNSPIIDKIIKFLERQLVHITNRGLLNQ